jgi:hypothetical protein
MGMEEHTCLHNEPAGKGRKNKKKKTLVLTLGSLPEKGGKKKKNPGINPGQRHLQRPVLPREFHAIIYKGRFCHRKCRTGSITVTSQTDNAINI